MILRYWGEGKRNSTGTGRYSKGIKILKEGRNPVGKVIDPKPHQETARDHVQLYVFVIN